jgi:hypothetical protein
VNVSLAVLVSIAAVGLVAIPAWGARRFSPKHARNVKYFENRAIAIQRVVEARLLHPEIIKIARIDRHPFFLMPHIGVLGYAVCVFSGAELTSNVTALGETTRTTMATCFFVGSSLVVIGAALGMDVFGRCLRPSTCEHLTSSVLGDDITLPYRLSMAGMSATSIALMIYSTTSFQSTGSLGGWLTGALAVASAITVPWFYRRVRQFEKWDATLISEAKSRLLNGVTDAD